MSLAISAAGLSAAGWLGLATVATAINTGYQANIASKDQKSAENRARADALRQEKLAEMEMNRNNRKSPNLKNILEANANGRGGISGTMLTGPQGVDSSSLSLGKSSLLGS